MCVVNWLLIVQIWKGNRHIPQKFYLFFWAFFIPLFLPGKGNQSSIGKRKRMSAIHVKWKMFHLDDRLEWGSLHEKEETYFIYQKFCGFIKKGTKCASHTTEHQKRWVMQGWDLIAHKIQATSGRTAWWPTTILVIFRIAAKISQPSIIGCDK